MILFLQSSSKQRGKNESRALWSKHPAWYSLGYIFIKLIYIVIMAFCLITPWKIKKNEKIKGDDMSNLKIKRAAAIIVMRKEGKTSGNAYDSHSQGNIPALHVFKTV